MRSEAWNFEVAIIFFTVLCVVIAFPAYVIAVLLDSLRRLRLMHETVERKLGGLRENTWKELCLSKVP